MVVRGSELRSVAQPSASSSALSSHEPNQRLRKSPVHKQDADKKSEATVRAVGYWEQPDLV